MKFEVKISKKPYPYLKAMELLDQKVADIYDNNSKNLLWILEHPNIYTGGTSSKDKDLLDSKKFPLFKTSRGGQWTFHGEGQKIVYLAHKIEDKNIKVFVRNIEKWIVNILETYNIKSLAGEKNIGIWVKQKKNETNKIAAIGIRVKKWVAYHGFALNVNVNKANYKGIIPCGIHDRGIANMTDFIEISKIKNLNETIIKKYKDIFV